MIDASSPKPANPWPKRGTRIGQYAILVAASILLGLPFFWMLITSLKSGAEVAQTPTPWWPSELHWSNFATAWNAAPFDRFYINSIITSVTATGLQLTTAALMAYALVFIPVPKKGLMLLLLIATLMIPEEMKLIPNYILLDRLGWIDTYSALIIPVGAHAFPVLVLYYQFSRVPKECIEASRMDGASHLHVLLRVVLPMTRPTLIALTFVVLLGRWNDFLWPLIVTNTEKMRTLPVGIVYLQNSQEGATRWEVLMAGSLIVMGPILLLFLLVQNHFMKGIRAGYMTA